MFGHYVIVREENGKWEYALAGGHPSGRSYSERLQDAAAWRTREAAEQNRCGNESIVDVRDILFFNTQD
jgi:hypothetical protein